MSRSRKARYGVGCKYWKDTFLCSLNQKRAWATRKRIETQRARRRAAVEVRAQVAAAEEVRDDLETPDTEREV